MGSSTSTSKSSSSSANKKGLFGMGPAQSMAMAGNTGLAGASTKEAETIKRTTGKSFKAIGQNIGEVGSKYRRPADVAKYAKELSIMEAGDVLGAKKFVGADGVERVSFVGTGMKDEQGRTILSKTTPQLNATAPTLKQLGGDMARGLMGYNSIKYIDDKPTMVKTEGVIPSLVSAAITGNLSPIGLVMKGVSKAGFFSYGDGKDAGTNQPTKAKEMNTTNDIADNDRKMRLEKRLALSKAGGSSDKTRPFLTVKGRGFGGTMN
ncbi:hypothetical protein [uncultured Mediterranean phage uvMED]|nr:hypothetical protein [uncultured Mediterranean phage uvMED]BAQ86755.1 hypothetical protein [uncultured Mediterranean phage uvMED]